MEQVVEQVLANVRQQLGEQYTLDDLAKMAMFSKFHFARMFRQVTGVSPRRFLYALRLQEAKRLLVTTSLSVAEVSHQVGYSSVGTFTSRFTASVGVPPAVYRRVRGDVTSVLHDVPPDPQAAGVITGRLEVTGGAVLEGPILVGLFRQPLPEGVPTRSEVVREPGDWTLRHVPSGRWYVLAVSPPPDDDSPMTSERQAMMNMSGPVRLAPEAPTAHVTIRLRPMRPVDPPILVPLAGLLHKGESPEAADRSADTARLRASGWRPVLASSSA